MEYNVVWSEDEKVFLATTPTYPSLLGSGDYEIEALTNLVQWVARVTAKNDQRF